MGAVAFLHGLMSRQVTTGTCGLYDEADAEDGMEEDGEEPPVPSFEPAWR